MRSRGLTLSAAAAVLPGTRGFGVDDALRELAARREARRHGNPPCVGLFVVAEEGGNYQWTGLFTLLAGFVAGMPIVGIKIGRGMLVYDRILRQHHSRMVRMGRAHDWRAPSPWRFYRAWFA